MLKRLLHALMVHLKILTCKHKHHYFVRNIYGDEINSISISKVYRSEWRCLNCQRSFFKSPLYSYLERIGTK